MQVREILRAQKVEHDQLRTAYYIEKTISKQAFDLAHRNLTVKHDITKGTDYTDKRASRRTEIDGINSFGQLRAFLKKERGL